LKPFSFFTGLDRGGEGRGVNLVQRLRVDEDVGGIGVVPDEMLGLGHDAFILDTDNLGRAHFPGQERVFAKGVVAAVEGEVTVDIDKRLQHNADAVRLRLAANQRSVSQRVFAAESGRKSQGRSRRDGWNAGQHSGRAVGQAHGRNAEPLDAGQVAGLALVGGGVLAGAVDHGDLLVEGHLAE
jgi:hypothetical protein